MATFPTSTLLPKLHQALSRRSLMREMAAAGMLAAVPVTSIDVSASANLPTPVPSPRIRMNLLIEELFSVAREFNPDIGRWTVVISEPDNKDDSKCNLLIAAFNEPMPSDGKAVIDWRNVRKRSQSKMLS